MKNIITAINNPELNNEIKKEKNLKILNKDIIYKEGIIEALEEKKDINLIIINYDLPGKMEIEELINKIKKINEKIELIFILEKEDIKKEEKLKKLNIKNIYYNNKINKEKLIKIIKKENNNKEEELQEEINKLKKIIENNKKEKNFKNIKNKIKNKLIKIKNNKNKKIKLKKDNNKIKNTIIINENEKNEGSEIILKIAKKAEKNKKKILIIDINLENKILQNIFNKKNIDKKINKKIKYLENSGQKNIEKKIENALFIKINKNINLLTGLNYYKNKNKEIYINKIINLIQKNSKKYYLIIIYFLEKNEEEKIKKELNKKIEKNIFIISNNYTEIKKLKNKLKLNNILENKKTYIFLKKEKNKINKSIIKNIFKKQKIITKI